MKIPRHIVDNFKKLPTKDKIKGIGAASTLALATGSGIIGYQKGKKSYKKEEHLDRLGNKIKDLESEIKEDSYEEPWERTVAKEDLRNLKRYKKKVENTSEKYLKKSAGKDKAGNNITNGIFLGAGATGAALLARKHPHTMGGAAIGAGILGTREYIKTKKKVSKDLKEEGKDPEQVSKISKGMATSSGVMGGIAGAGLGAIAGKGLKIIRKLKK